MSASSAGEGTRRLLRDLARLALVSALLLLAGEIAARTCTGRTLTRDALFQRVASGYGALFRPHPWLHSSTRARAALDAPGTAVGTVRLNALGYRSPERALEKRPGARRVVVAGGSTTFDTAPDDASTWLWRLEATLRARDPAIEVWNAGVPSWTSLENLISLAIRDVDLEPDLVVLYQGINDLQPASLEPFDPQYERHAEIVRSALGLELEPLAWYRRSLLVEWLSDHIFGPRDPAAAMRPVADSPRGHRIPDAAVRCFERNVRSIVALARAHGARVLLVTQPMRLRAATRAEDVAYMERWVPGLFGAAAPLALEQLNGGLRRLAAELGVPLADAARAIPWTDADFADPVHYTESGRSRLERFLVEPVLGALGGEAGAP